MERIFVSVEEAGKAIGLGRTTVYELLRDGRLRSITIGRRRLICARSLEALVGRESE
jgi:excisionase family DNA binding protein